MSELISGKEALMALANGEDVEYITKGLADTKYWSDSEKTRNFTIHDFYSGSWVFRRKPQTITLNGIEVPAPFKPKDGEVFWHIFPTIDQGYGWCYEDSEDESIKQFGAWRTEEEIKQVVEVLRSIFNAN